MLRSRLAALQQTGAGMFVRKVLDDRITALGVLIAWGTLTTLIPMLLGMMALASLVMRDPQREAELLGALVNVLPIDAVQPIQAVVEHSQSTAGIAGIISLGLLLFNGANFFANLEWVFNMAYHVEDRNLVVQRVRGVVMLVVVVALALLSTTAFGVSGALSAPKDPVLSRLPFVSQLSSATTWAVSIISAIAMFWLMYRVLPNKPQSWRQSLPGALLVTVLFFLLLELFPLYMHIFGGGFEAYAAFGMVMVLTFWLYLLGLAMALGAELNAFLEQPARSTALAQTQARAEQGQVRISEDRGQVHTEAEGSAPRRGREGEAGRRLDLPWSGRRRAS